VRHAVVVGANEGGGVLEELRYAERDAGSVADLLVELGNFDQDLVTVLYAPTAEQLRTALAEHASVSAKYEDDMFLLYYSGHADAQGLRLGDDRYFFETLKHDFRVVDADVRIGILDSCRSGTITRLKGASVSESLFGNDGGTVEGEAWLTASAADELAQESDDLRGGFFTHYLLSGMRGAADTNDAVVDLDELYRYTLERVVANTGGTSAGTQHPHFQNKLQGSGGVSLTDMRNASAIVVLPEAVNATGHISVLRRPDLVQIAEFSKSPDHELKLALPPGSYTVRRNTTEDLYETGFDLGEGQQYTIDDWGVPKIAFASTLKGDEALRNQFIETSQSYEDHLNLKKSTAVAGGASLVIPGAGQLYNGNIYRGAAYFAATYALMAGALFDPGQNVDPNISTMFGAALWGASIADAIHGVHGREKVRPVGGGQISFGGGFGGDNWNWPHHFGLSADIMVFSGKEPNGKTSLSIGLDRVGYTPYQDGFDAHVGSRMMIGWEGNRWRPAAFMAFGIRYGDLPEGTAKITRSVFGAGGNLRYYFVPRYFTEVEARWERDGDQGGLRSGVAFGIHLGR